MKKLFGDLPRIIESPSPCVVMKERSNRGISLRVDSAWQSHEFLHFAEDRASAQGCLAMTANNLVVKRESISAKQTARQ